MASWLRSYHVTRACSAKVVRVGVSGRLHWAGMMVAAAALVVAACGEATDGKDEEKSDDDTFEDPNPGLPTHAEDPYAWGELSAGLPQPFDVRDLVVAGGVVHASITAYFEHEPGEKPTVDGEASGIYVLDEEALRWSRVAPDSNKYGSSDLVGGPDGALYGFRQQSLYRLEGDAWISLKQAPGKLDWLVPPAGDEQVLFGIREGETVVDQYEIAADEWTNRLDGQAEAESFGLPGGSGSTATVTEDGTLYTSRKWAIRDSEGKQGAVFRLDDGGWEDATFNLRETRGELPVHLLNATGSGWGPFGGIQRAPDGRDLFGTTEQGAFHFIAAEERWVPIAAIWYGAKVEVAGGTLCIGKQRLYRYFDDTRRQLVGTYDKIAFNELKHLVSPSDSPVDEQLFIAAFSRTDEYKGDEYSYSTIVASRVRPDAPILDRNLKLDAAAYVAGSGTSERPAGVAWNDDGSHVLAVTSLEADGQDELQPVGGQLLHYQGTELLGSVDLQGPARDLVSLAGGGVVVATAWGLESFAGDLAAPGWSMRLEQGAARVDVAEDGTVVALSDKSVIVLDAQGKEQRRFTLKRNYLEDVAVSSSDGLVYVVGFDNQNNGAPVQVPYLVAHRLEDGQQAYKVWGYDPSTLDNDMADSRLYRVTLGEDGALYVLGETAGGNTMFRWNGRDLETSSLVTFDPYNTATNTASEHKGYFARLDPKTGELDRGQLIIARLSDGGGNSFRGRALAADAGGRVYVGGVSAARFSGRDLSLIDGQLVASYDGGDPSLLVVSPDFGTRERWTTFTKTPAHGFVLDLDIDTEGRVILAAESNHGELFTTEGGLGAQDPGDDEVLDAWFASFDAL